MSRLKKGHKLTRLGLITAYAGLLVLFACPLATSTLAWFSIGSYNTIRNIEFGFDPGTKLKAQLKSLDNGEWIDPDSDGSFRFSDEFSFAPVSNMFSGSDGYSEGWYSTDLDPEVDKPKYMLGYGGSGITTTTRTDYAEENNQYISLEFRFSCDRDIYLFLDTKSTKVEADRETNKAMASNVTGLSEDNLNRVENACRISFFGNMGYTVYEPNATEGSSTYYGGRLNTRSVDGYWDYDEKTGKETLYGEYKSEALSKLEYTLVSEQEPVSDPLNTLEAVSKQGNLAISNLSSLKEEGLIARETSYTLQELGNNASNRHPLLFIPAGQTRKLTVSIYIEGWDLDCDTFIEAATLAASITFTGVYATKGASGFPYPVLGADAKQN